MLIIESAVNLNLYIIMEDETNLQSKLEGIVTPGHELHKTSDLSLLLPLLSGAFALAAGLVTIFTNLSVLEFNPSVVSKLNITNSTLSKVLSSIVSTASDLRSALLIFAPLLIVTGVLMLVTGLYLRKNRENIRSFDVFLVFLFSIMVLLGILLVLPFSPISLILIYVYLMPSSPVGTTGAANIAGTATYILLLAYMISGLLAGFYLIRHVENASSHEKS